MQEECLDINKITVISGSFEEGNENFTSETKAIRLVYIYIYIYKGDIRTTLYIKNPFVTKINEKSEQHNWFCNIIYATYTGTLYIRGLRKKKQYEYMTENIKIYNNI